MATVSQARESAIAAAEARRRNWTPYLFLAPSAVLVLLFFFIPAILLFWVSLTNQASSNFSNPDFIGLENYRIILNDRFVGTIFLNTIFYVVVTLICFNVGMALIIALVSTHIDRRSGIFFRTLWMLPRLTPSVIYIMMWKRIAAGPPYGILNALLAPLGVEGVNWLSAHGSPWLFVILSNGFIGASFGMIIFTSAIESIPKELMRAALVDGATIWQRIRFLILPYLRWPLLFVVTYQSLSLLTSFEMIWLLTDGGPGLYRTEVWALTAYKRALANYFGNAQWGQASAWAVFLVIIGIALSVIYMRYFRFGELVSEPKIEVL